MIGNMSVNSVGFKAMVQVPLSTGTDGINQTRAVNVAIKELKDNGQSVCGSTDLPEELDKPGVYNIAVADDESSDKLTAVLNALKAESYINGYTTLPYSLNFIDINQLEERMDENPNAVNELWARAEKLNAPNE